MSPSLLSLPRELRDEIYSYVLGNHVIHIDELFPFELSRRLTYKICTSTKRSQAPQCSYLPSSCSGSARLSMAILRCSKTLKQECGLVLYTKNQFTFRDLALALEFSQKLSPTWAAAVRNIHVDLTIGQTVPQLENLLWCRFYSGLRNVHIRIKLGHWMAYHRYPTFSPDSRFLRSWSDDVWTFPLLPLTMCPLQSVQISIDYSGGVPADTASNTGSPSEQQWIACMAERLQGDWEGRTRHAWDLARMRFTHDFRQDATHDRWLRPRLEVRGVIGRGNMFTFSQPLGSDSLEDCQMLQFAQHGASISVMVETKRVLWTQICPGDHRIWRLLSNAIQAFRPTEGFRWSHVRQSVT